ncbi:MAG: carbamoyltransferase HypF [Nitrospirota bacterium]
MRARIQVTGVVQGVGFRPFIHNLAQKYRLKGFCRNDSEGVLIEVESDTSNGGIEDFVKELMSSAPPLSRIDSLFTKIIPGEGNYKDFTIRESLFREGKSTFVSPDIAVCPDCVREMFDPHDRRYGYPFVNCTNCGPRYSIVLDIPYDRPKTTMASFTMCSECTREYNDPADRRFHAQPNACQVCGPKLELIVHRSSFTVKEKENPVETAIALLKQGAIVAIKGLGGFHLCCDATNRDAVARLRERKRNSNKPFALMAPNSITIKNFCVVSEEEERLLESRIRPIVLLKKKVMDNGPKTIGKDRNEENILLPDEVAPGNSSLGFMLPYTPLHYLLFSGEGKQFTALVMTSGNRSEEPIVTSNDEALKKLAPLADAFLLHNRDIYMRVDDSIVRAGNQEPEARSRNSDDRSQNTEIKGKETTSSPSFPPFYIIRRARGFVPDTIDLGEEFREILACGADLKNTFCLTKGSKAIPSQHIGDLEHYETLGFFGETLRNLKNTFRVAPEAVAHDMHPDYFSTKLALEYAREHDIPEDRCIPVQHHHAHIVSVMAEHGLREKVIGIAFDGTGYGMDGHIWGGEFLVADRVSFERAAHFRYVPLPGGDKAVKEPWRAAAAYLHQTFGDHAFEILPSFFRRFKRADVDAVLQMVKNSIHAPLTSSAGRLFDAVSSVIGLRDRITFEGEAAIDLEMAAHAYRGITGEPYPYNKEGSSIDMSPAIEAIAGDCNRSVETGAIARRFHATMGEVILNVAKEIREESGLRNVVMSGGVFQNRLLTEISIAALRKNGFAVWMNERVPANDGGISLGQAAVAWERMKKGVQ